MGRSLACEYSDVTALPCLLRWNDVNQHWNSLCKLLSETLLHLEATYAEVRYVLQITQEEFDWLEGCENTASARQATRGNLEVIQEEIDRHSVRRCILPWPGGGR